MLPTTLALCWINTFFFGSTVVEYSAMPRGTCDYCCPILEKDIKFKLYTRSNPVRHERLKLGETQKLVASRFENSRPTIIYLHGFTETAPGNSGSAMRDAYLQRGDYNVILVDWAPLVTLPWYLSAVRNTRFMGLVLAQFIAFLIFNGTPLSSLHVIGFSLGAEAAGFAGKRLKMQGILLPRITGLDPAYPGYSWTGRSGHLSRGDAAFVDVIHTNAGVLGYPTPLGDVDFYPNEGTPLQPGCTPTNLAMRRLLEMLIGCSHNRAWRYYTESVTNERGFPATRCNRWDGFLPPCQFTIETYMGIAASTRSKGKLYLHTNSNPPFARGVV